MGSLGENAYDSGYSSQRAVLKAVLLSIKEHDTEYHVRYGLVLMAMGMAADLGMPVGIRFDPDEGPEWPVVYIELPTGQVSWHMPQHPVPWDGHDTEEKYRRIREYTDG